jgi:outer membrane protein
MLRMTRVLFACGLTWLAMIPQTAMSQDAPGRIGYVSLDRILKESLPARAAEQKLETEFAKRGRDLEELVTRLKAAADKFDKDASVMPESERLRRQRELSDQDRDVKRRQDEFKEDINRRKYEELNAVIERANRVIRQVSEADKYDLIVQDAVFTSPRIDITDKVIKVLNTPSAATPK